MEAAWEIIEGNGPLVAAAIHCGHDVRGELAPLFALNSDDRLREEDPFTDVWATVASHQILGGRSRFEVDLNRPREKAVYRRPADAWGLNVWREELPESVVEESLAIYDDFYADVKRFLQRLVKQHSRIVVFDIHSYTHRRAGEEAPAANPDENPEINVGTGTMRREVWANVVDRFLSDFRRYDFHGRSLDVRENVKFRGGHFPEWIHATFPGQVCVLSIEFKKFFTDEWTGQPDHAVIDALRAALLSTVVGIREELAVL